MCICALFTFLLHKLVKEFIRKTLISIINIESQARDQNKRQTNNNQHLLTQKLT